MANVAVPFVEVHASEVVTEGLQGLDAAYTEEVSCRTRMSSSPPYNRAPKPTKDAVLLGWAVSRK